MSIYAIGLNHTTAPLALREQFAFAAHELSASLSELKRQLNAQVALLSTCNRTELYFAPHLQGALMQGALIKGAPISGQTSNQALKDESVSSQFARAAQALAALKNVPAQLLQQHSYQLHNEHTVRHAYRVASGLDSMVLGEAQILGQMKTAMRCAQDAGALGTTLQYLFQQSFSVAKQVRTQTQVGAASVSMAAAAVRLSQRIFGDLSQCKVLMIGAGQMIELCATHFAGHQPKSICIANRTLARAQALAQMLDKQAYKAHIISLAQVPEALSQYDIVISCTASTLPIIGLGVVQRALAHKASQRQTKTTMMVDLAVPRDIEPEVGNLADVYLYTVDDLGRVVQEGRQARSAAVSQANELIDARVRDFTDWQASRRAVPAVQQLQRYAQQLRDDQLSKALKQLSIGSDAAQVLGQLSQQLTQKLLHQTLAITQHAAADTRINDATLEHILRSVLRPD